MSSFLQKKGEVDILLEREPDTKKPLFEILKEFEKQKQVNIKITKFRPKYVVGSEKKEEYEINFSIVDDFAYRMETDKSKKEAHGSFFDKRRSRELIGHFDSMFNNNDSTEDFKLVNRGN